MLEDLVCVRDYIAGVHLWGKRTTEKGKRVAHTGDLNNYFFGSTTTKSEFLSAARSLFDDGKKRNMVLEVNSGNDDMVELPDDKEADNEKPEKRYVAETSSFKPLAEYLGKQEAETLLISFAEIEAIIGKELCMSAKKYASYWYPAYDRPVANVIYNAGYDVAKVDMGKHGIELIRN